MAEYSISTEDHERSDDPTTSTPLLESTYVRRRKRRLEKYLAGAGRAAVNIKFYRDLQRSLRSNESSVLSKETYRKTWKRVEECSRGCPAVL